MNNIKYGKYTVPTGAHPQNHEIETAEFLKERGFEVEFLVPSYSKGVPSPDIRMGDILWEIKSPKNDGKYTIEHLFRKALRQSKNIIFDLRRSKMSDKQCLAQLERQVKLVRNVKRLLIITKSHMLLDFIK